MEDSASNVDKKGMSRRAFLNMVTGTGLLVGLTGALTGCGRAPGHAGGTGWLPYQYNAPGNLPANVRGRVPIDTDNPSIIRDDLKCILCGQCLEVCQNLESVYGYYDLPVIDETICIHCGQCSMACPSGAISERDDTQKVFEALEDKSKFVLVQTAPATRVALGEEFGMATGSWVEGKQVVALRKLGFDAVLDTNFTADLTIWEEATELVKRVTGAINMPLPQFTSCSPGWIKFCEYFYPELIDNLSTCKSPQQMFGVVAKTYYAEKKRIDPKNIVSVSVMPCTAKKFEAKRPEMNDSAHYWVHRGRPDLADLRDVDIVITTRELARMIKQKRIDFSSLPETGREASYDNLMGEETGGAIIFANTGGVMEAAARSAYFFITQQPPPAALLQLDPVRGINKYQPKSATLSIPGAPELRVAVVTGLANARQILDETLDAKKRGLQPPYHFIEFMTCPGGCIAGGGQPRTAVPPTDAIRQQRIDAIYKGDAAKPKRSSHENTEIQALYKEFLKEPMSELSEELLHTDYHSRADKLLNRRLSAVV